MTVYILSVIKGLQTCVHLKNGKVWSTLHATSLHHDELIKWCHMHLVYMGFGIFLCLVRQLPIVPNVKILGTIHSNDPATLHELVSTSKGVIDTTKPKPAPTATTSTPSAAAGSASQLPQVEAELKSKPLKPDTPKDQTKPAKLAKLAKLARPASPPNPAKVANPKPSAKPTERQETDTLAVPTSPKSGKVSIMLFSVNLVHLTPDEIDRHTAAKPTPPSTSCANPMLKLNKIMLHKLLLKPKQTVTLVPPKLKKPSNKEPQWWISGHPSKVQSTNKQQHTFHVQQHVLKRRIKKVYLKCQVKNCQQAYQSFLSVKALNVHHQIYHPKVLFSCPVCPKHHHTPSSARFHKYEHQILRYTCSRCNKQYVYQSKLRQHRRVHICHKMYCCFYGGCSKQYKHSQDLDQHVASHLGRKFDCPLCNYSSNQKRLLKCHSAVHQTEI